MPALIALLEPLIAWAIRALTIAAIVNAAGVVMKILAVLGLHFFVVQPFVDDLMAMAQSQFSGLPGSVAAWVGYLNFDKYISLILSAYSVRATTNFVMGMTPGTGVPASP